MIENGLGIQISSSIEWIMTLNEKRNPVNRFKEIYHKPEIEK
jgi:hypothetical protein